MGSSEAPDEQCELGRLPKEEAQAIQSGMNQPDARLLLMLRHGLFSTFGVRIQADFSVAFLSRVFGARAIAIRPDFTRSSTP